MTLDHFVKVQILAGQLKNEVRCYPGATEREFSARNAMGAPLRHTLTFTAHDENGNEYEILVFTPDRESRDMYGVSRVQGKSPGMLKTSDGRGVNWLSQGKYEIVGRPMIPISSDDSAAP